MHIAHIGLFTNDLERLKDFYCEFLGGKVKERYDAKDEDFHSYFITFGSGSALELMSRSNGLEARDNSDESCTGYSHVAYAVSGREEVDGLTRKMKEFGCTVAIAPRVTGDGYYESCVLDPDGNRIEITAE